MIEPPSKCYCYYDDIDVETLISGKLGPKEEDWFMARARFIEDQSVGIVFKISDLQLPLAESRQLAIRTAKAINAALIRLGAPSDMHMEVDQVQETYVVDNRATRTLLPHHDGGHATYLTPCVADDPSWATELRTFSETGFTSHAHKLYQGFFIQEAGEYESLTSYYDLLAILRDAYLHQHRTTEVTIPKLQSWLGGNLRRLFELRKSYPFNYVNLGALFGSTKLEHLVIDIHYREAPVRPEQKRFFPNLFPSDAGRFYSETAYLMDQVCLTTLGFGWEQFRERYEVVVQNATFDFIIGHNLNLLHGGIDAGGGRLIEPICLVMEHPLSSAYDSWLSKVWRKHEDVWG